MLALRNYLWQKPEERAVVASVLERMCVNPMLDRVNGIRGMAMDVQKDFETAVSAQNDSRTSSKALIKLRGELVRLFEMQQALAASAQSDSERAMTDELLNDMEQISRKAHEAIGFTYTPLEQMAVLQ